MEFFFEPFPHMDIVIDILLREEFIQKMEAKKLKAKQGLKKKMKQDSKMQK